jgi:PAS domain S-box-containing protein
MNNLLKNPNYSSIYVMDAQRNVLVRTVRIYENIGVVGTNAAIESFYSGQIKITDLFEDNDGSVHMDMVIPIQNSSDDKNTVLAVVIVQIDPTVALFPMIESWPSTYETAETLLVRQEGDEVVYLNKLRFNENSPLTLRFPLTNTNLPAVMAVNGATGIVEGTDYRNISVIASIYPIKGTNWILVAKIDRNEIFGSLKIQLWNIVLTMAFLLLAIGLSLDVLWRRQSSRYYQNLYQTEVARRGFEEKYSTLFNQANDAILLIEEGGKIVGANDQAVKMYGYSLDELLSLSISDLRDEKVIPKIQMDMELVKNGTVNIFETTHRKKNGKIFSVDVSSRFLSIGGKGYFQSLVRDVTQRKKAEDQLLRSELALKKAQQVSHVGSWYWNAVTNKIDRSDEMYHLKP